MVIKNLMIVGRRCLVDDMNDPWDVKSVRKSGQYMSCMKINGVPLLPPVLSKECRKEMQYYKLLAREVEKRIALLKPYTLDSDTEDVEDIMDAPDIPESEQVPVETTSPSISPRSSPELSLVVSPKPCLTMVSPNIMEYCNITKNCEEPPNSKIIMDLTLDLIGANRSTPMQHTSQMEIPERDCESPIKKKEEELLTDVQLVCSPEKRLVVMETVKSFVDNILTDPYGPLKPDGPSSLSSKSFTGSLNDLHTESLKESQKCSNLIRQRSYTLLKPSPQLLAHLEVQSLNTGVEMSNISMSESLSNLSAQNKKRRSWDLETAKVKWSSMAMELNTKNVPKQNGNNKNFAPKNVTSPSSGKKTSPNAPRSKSVAQDRPRRANVVTKTITKSESAQKLIKKPHSPVRNSTSVPINRPNIETNSPKNALQKKDANPIALISESDDPATKVKELYEKIQRQQQAQMASLVEKQKREQLLLQKVFEEQNNLLFKQLKTICPKSPLEAKEAWVDKVSDPDKGPVSLSQLINQKSPETVHSPVSSTLTETHNYINQCNDVLKKSRNITGSLKKHIVSKNQHGAKIQSPRNGDGSITRTHSPSHSHKSTSRRLNYDTSNSSERECEPPLTERSNDTFADLNVTFPSDHSDEPMSNQMGSRQPASKKKCSPSSSPVHNLHEVTKMNIDAAIKDMEDTVHKSIKAQNNRKILVQKTSNVDPTGKERGAATRIVAYAKGYLVRRLMRTERVQATVQTIRDALLCALQLHQDRAGIRGADVDLHRRLIQQITAACYSLHDAFVASSAADRCAMIAADRGRKRALASRPTPRPRSHLSSDMTQSHSGSFPTRVKRPPSSPMTQSSYETFSSENLNSRCVPSPPRRPWR